MMSASELRPHQADHLAEREALALQLLDGNRRRAPEQMGDDEVRLEAAGDVEDLRAHLEAGRRHREGAHLEALGLGEVLEDGQRLLARRVVVVDVGDLLALEVAAQLLLGEGHRGARLRPVAGRDREGVRVALAVGGRGRAEAGRRAEDLVLLQLLVQRRGLRRAVEAFQHGAFLLEALVRFDGRRHLVSFHPDFFVDIKTAASISFTRSACGGNLSVKATSNLKEGDNVIA